MQFLKQSTAATIKLGPFVDDTDGKTAETSLTISQADIRLSKNGGDIAQTNNETGATHDELGYYNVPLDATDTNTLGRLLVAVHESGALPVWKEFMIVTANVYDTLCSTDSLDVNVTSLADDVITAGKFDESTAYPLKSADTGATALARTGADSDTLETLSDQIDTIDSSGVAAAVWSNPDRTLTQTATSITSSVSGSTITDVRGDTWSIDITDLTLDTHKQQFAIKRHAGDADSAALLFVDSDDGLLYIYGAAGTASDASLVYAGTTLTLTVKPAATAQIPSGTHKYGIQSVTAAGVVNEAYGGSFTVQADVVKATS